jgi:hypothetical protein
MYLFYANINILNKKTGNNIRIEMSIELEMGGLLYECTWNTN